MEPGEKDESTVLECELWWWGEWARECREVTGGERGLWGGRGWWGWSSGCGTSRPRSWRPPTLRDVWARLEPRLVPSISMACLSCPYQASLYVTLAVLVCWCDCKRVREWPENKRLGGRRPGQHTGVMG